MKNSETLVYKKNNPKEAENNSKFLSLLKNSPIPDDEILESLPLYIKRRYLARILFLNEIYQKILETNGIIFELGVRWGHNLTLFESLRGLYEPFNHTRKIVGFDTFEGFRSIDGKDGDDDIIKEGNYSVSQEYESYLEELLICHENESPISHIRKFELIKGDATKTIKQYLDNNPHTILSMVYFDFDLYEPTKVALELVLNYCTKGTLLVFDELNHPKFPGETLAVKEVLDLGKHQLQRSKFSSYQSYIIL